MAVDEAMDARTEQDHAETLGDILDVLASTRATSIQRLEQLSHLERIFGEAVVEVESRSRTEQRKREQQWWRLQSFPETCVAQVLLALLHRLHLSGCYFDATSSTTSANDKLRSLSAEMTACFTILQGLALRHKDSQALCARRSSIELVMDILEGEYWTACIQEAEALSHAVDYLICATMVSLAACSTFESLNGEQRIRSIMERSMIRASPTKRTASSLARQAITMEAVQQSPLAMKCVEFLLLLASERDEEAFDKTCEMIAEHQPRPSVARQGRVRQADERKASASYDVDVRRRAESPAKPMSRRALSLSPVKDSGSRRDNVASCPGVPSATASSPNRPEHAGRLASSRSPTKSFPPNRLASPRKRDAASATSLFGRQHRTLPDKTLASQAIKVQDLKPYSRGSAHRQPLDKIVTNTGSDGSTDEGIVRRSTPRCYSELKIAGEEEPSRTRRISSPFDDTALGNFRGSNSSRAPSTTLSSPLRSLMGPSPAVRRAHARSMSPEKHGIRP